MILIFLLGWRGTNNVFWPEMIRKMLTTVSGFYEGFFLQNIFY